MNDTTEQIETPSLQFPCDFVLKVMGHDNEAFELRTLEIIQKHYPNTPESNISRRSSKSKKYIALSVTVHATSKAELDALYQDLSQCPEVLMAL